MTEDDVKRTIDAHLDEEYALADPDDLDNLDIRVDSQERKIHNLEKSVAHLTDRNNQLVDVVCVLAEKQGIEVRVEA